MPRAEQPLVRDGSVLVEFAADLRLLRQKAGLPSYRAMGRMAHYSATTLAEAAGGRKLPSLAVTLAFVRACDGDQVEWEPRWHAVAAEINARSAVTVPVKNPTDDESSAPYVGLRSFGLEDAELFFGRERLVADVLDRLGRQRLVVLFGASGSGKSSVLRAGIVPALRTDDSPVVMFTPGTHPVEQGSVRVASVLGLTPGVVTAEWLGDVRGLHRLALQMLVDCDDTSEVVIVVDQFEEVFTLCRDAEERARFIAALTTAATTPGSRCRVVLGMRSDFFAHCAAHPALLEALPEGQVVVGPMSSDELRRAIVQPAKRRQCAVESALLAELIAHAHGQTGVLPMLSHVLLQVWGRRSGNLLTLAGFQAAGGLDGALSRTAENVFTGLDDDQQRSARALFRRLIALGEGTEDTKRRLDNAELDHDPNLPAALDAFTQARLLTTDRGGVEITHEALIRAWPRLHGWLTEDRDGLRVHRALTEATAAWLSLDREASTLYRGLRLETAQDWAAADSDDAGLSIAEREFLDCSIGAYVAEQNAARRQTHRLRQLVAVLAALLLVLSTTVVWALRAERTAADQRNRAVALRSAATAVELMTDDPVAAARMSLAAHQLSPTPETQDSLIGAHAELMRFDHGPRPLGLPALSDSVLDEKVLNATTVLGKGESGRSRLYDTSTTPYTALGYFDGVVATAELSGDGRILVAADYDAGSSIWDVTDREHPRRIGEMPDHLFVSDVSSDGRFVLTLTRASLATLPVHDPALSPAIPWIPDLPFQLWDIGDPVKPRLLPTDLTFIDSAVFSPSEDVLVTTGQMRIDGPEPVATFWEVNPSGELRKLTDVPDSSALRVPDFSADGRFIVFKNPDSNEAPVFDLQAPATPRLVTTVKFLPPMVFDYALNSDGTRLVVDSESSITVWSLTPLHPPTPTYVVVKINHLEEHVDFLGDGKRISVVHGDRDLRGFRVFDTDVNRIKRELCARPDIREGSPGAVDLPLAQC